jgi:hypothetical protein
MTVVESPDTSPQAGDSDQPQAGNPTHDSQAEPEPISLEEVRKLRQENAATRRKLREREAELEQHRSAGLSELEKAQRRIAELEARESEYQAAQRARALERLFAAENAQYPDLLVRQIDPTDLDLAPDGSIVNGSALVSRLKKQYPGLFRVPSADAGASGTPDAGSDINAFIRRQAGR